MSSEQQSYPVLPLEFSGQRLLTLTQPQVEELQSIYGENAPGDRFYEYLHSLPNPSEKQ
jgi:hypothetical protein